MESRYAPVSFMAKYVVKKYPVFGDLATLVGCLYIKRDSEEDRKKALTDIKQRIHDFDSGVKGINPMMIFPEGTTDNGRSIIKFKVGAFETLSRITAFGFHYEC